VNACFVDTYPVGQSTGYRNSNHLKMVKKTTGFEPVWNWVTMDFNPWDVELNLW